jgi:hypothetical protein
MVRVHSDLCERRAIAVWRRKTMILLIKNSGAGDRERAAAAAKLPPSADFAGAFTRH